MIDELVPQIEALEAQGAVVILKWDGERESLKKTVLITRYDTDFTYRADTDNFREGFLIALEQYEKHHGKGD